MTWIRDHEQIVWWLGIVSLVTFVATLVIVPILVVRMPEDYFSGDRHFRDRAPHRHPVLHVLLFTIKNTVGALFIVAGLAMLLLPGQGILTILIGLTLTSFPGKFALERWIAGRRPVLRAINWIRTRAGRPVLRDVRSGEA